MNAVRHFGDGVGRVVPNPGGWFKPIGYILGNILGTVRPGMVDGESTARRGGRRDSREATLWVREATRVVVTRPQMVRSELIPLEHQ
ncbi:hypothetical protein M413DRAFT_440216 [Hebeloma cylindrosporum]|uniref:Uncharacterized protein n=1 Tax=Hebeloma cylindrosporum TaxID=76867 RepID=A0A0C3CXA6_HEBCY|nr:hypothetical protein M413DRAFT_440216 [Hebeloma cylindrosporum h7]